MTYKTLDDYIKQEFPSKYLRGDDLEGKEVVVTIGLVEKESIFNPQKNKHNNRITLYFHGKDKGVILGVERSKELKALFGNVAPEELVGKTVTLYARQKGPNNVLHIKAAHPIAAGLQLNQETPL